MVPTNLSSETTANINNLLGYLHDSYLGYDESADMIKNPQLKDKFITAANQRRDMIQELAQIVKFNAEEPKESGTFAGTAHRVFTNLKSLVTNHDTSAILKEVNRGEQMLMDEYKTALESVEQADVRAVLQDQLITIEQDQRTWQVLS